MNCYPESIGREVYLLSNSQLAAYDLGVEQGTHYAEHEADEVDVKAIARTVETTNRPFRAGEFVGPYLREQDLYLPDEDPPFNNADEATAFFDGFAAGVYAVWSSEAFVSHDNSKGFAK